MSAVDKTKTPRTPAPKLQESQLNAIINDVDLKSLNLSLKGYASEWIIEAITEAVVERTCEGASTLSITALDRDRVLINSPYLASDVYTELDGLWFALVGVDKSGDFVTLIWEDREVYILRKYNKPKTAVWGKTTRAKFIRDMVREVKEVKIDFICPEIGLLKPIGTDTSTDIAADLNRKPGFADAHDRANARVTVKNVPADREQMEMISRVLNVGVAMKVRRKLLVCAVMTITVESNARNLDHGDLDSVGLFQQRSSWGTKAERMRPEYAAGKFYDAAKDADLQSPWAQYGDLCQSVQRSAFPEAYQQWLTEANHTVKNFGVAGSDGETSSQTENSQGVLVAEDGTLFLGGAAGADYQFTRGQFSQGQTGRQKVKREDTWSASGRMADEVNWRRFIVNGDFYYVSEPFLFKSRPRLVIKDEYDESIISLNFRYEIGQANAEVTVTAFAKRWAAPPGSIVQIDDIGVLRGRWLVTTIKRSLFSPIATITMKKPRPILPEPTQAEAFDEFGESTDQSASTAALASGYVAPLPTDGNLEVSEFTMLDGEEGAPDDFGRHHHAGKDWYAPAKTPVVAPIGGTIIRSEDSGGDHTSQSFGGVVAMKQDNGIVWLFRHVEPTERKVGARVLQGTVIGYVSEWDKAPGSTHAHIEVWKTEEGGYDYENMLDPVRVLKDEVDLKDYFKLGERSYKGQGEVG